MIRTITKLTLSVLFLAILAKPASAQYVLQSTNLPGVGDIWVNKIITDPNVQPGGSGANIPWDFSIYFVTPNTISEQYVVPTGTATDLTFPGANLKCTSFFGMTDYFKKNSSTNELEYLGFYSSSNEIHISNTQKLFTVPLAYGASVSNVPVTGTGFQGSALSGTISVVADAYGTLTVGGVTSTNVLRVRTEYALVEDFGGGLTETISIIRYAWYKSGLRAPYMQICTFDMDGAIGSLHQKYSLVANITTDINEISKPAINFAVYPNPVVDRAEVEVTIDQSVDLTIRLLDITGKTCKEEIAFYSKGTHNLSIDVSELPKGVYIVSLQGGATIREERIVITN
ncbi:MAG: T9SS type A sorting domain-containing protein [Bacteroidia bacterium]|nr:T9SS type A sorting domain-containing protein [Bacteroidia bacterium]